MESQPTNLPDSLRAQFAALERALWRKETTVAVSAAVVALLISLLALFISDRIWDTPRAVRMVLTLGGLGLGLWLVQRWWSLWYWRRRDMRAFSKIVQKHHRRLGDRLLGIVELAEQTELLEGMSPALCRAAIRQVTDDAAKMDFSEAVDFRPARKLLIGTGIVAGILALLAIIAPMAVGNSLKRWLMPASEAPRYTFVKWQDVPAEIVVPHGEAFRFETRVAYQSFWRPQDAVATIGLHEAKATVESGLVKFDLPPQTVATELKLRVGDASSTLRVRPEHRPALRQLTARVELPAYLQQPPLEESAMSGKLRVLADTKVILAGNASRPLKQAWLQLDRQKPMPLEVKGSQFLSTPLVLADAQRATFGWTDELGLTNRAPWLLGIEATVDAAPMVELSDLAMDVAILEDEVLRINTAARDDFGVRELSLAWEQISGPAITNSPGTQVLRRPTTNSVTRQFNELFVFSPSVLNIPSDTTVEVRALATDFLPNRVPSETARFRVHVVGHVKHAEMVRQQFEQMFAKLEEVTRKEEALANATRELKQQPEEKLNTEAAAARAEELAKQQEQVARQLQDVARSGTETLKEALRNPTFNEETLRDWARTLQAMQELSKKEMKDASQSLQQAQQKAAERQEQLAKAQTSEEEATRALEKMQQDVNQGLDRLQAQTLAQRLRQISKDEQKIAEHLQTIVPETVGLLPAELPSRYLNTINDLSGSQAKARKDAETVQDEMGRFFERTQKAIYGEVSKDMKDAETVPQLDKLRHTMLANVSLQSLQNLGAWTKRFNDWADKLEPKSDSKSGEGQGQGEGKPPQDDNIKLLMSFLRMRAAEHNLIDRTKLLEQRKSVDPQYAQNAKKLAEAQFLSRRQILDIQFENNTPELDKPLEDTFQSMRNTENVLGKPQTDAVALDAELKVVENLSDMINLLNEQQRKNSQSSSSASASEMEMAFLMQMAAQPAAPAMGMQQGSNPGMNQSGGDTSRTNQAATGDGRGNRDNARTTGSTTGVTQPVPVEFRDALESYFKAIEKLDE
ncbi:MAG: hypothetical protein K0Q55_1199 [Verrucomicrobia bacterium]|nr:hypothetical protein [Verrucomicrobiota bacterium]